MGEQRGWEEGKVTLPPPPASHHIPVPPCPKWGQPLLVSPSMTLGSSFQEKDLAPELWAQPPYAVHQSPGLTALLSQQLRLFHLLANTNRLTRDCQIISAPQRNAPYRVTSLQQSMGAHEDFVLLLIRKSMKNKTAAHNPTTHAPPAPSKCSQ